MNNKLIKERLVDRPEGKKEERSSKCSSSNQDPKRDYRGRSAILKSDTIRVKQILKKGAVLQRPRDHLNLS